MTAQEALSEATLETVRKANDEIDRLIELQKKADPNAGKEKALSSFLSNSCSSISISC